MSYSFETGIYRPPSEGGSSSLLVRVTRNCPWNLCTFCGMYKAEKFSRRSTAEVKADIDTVAIICRELEVDTDIPSQRGGIDRDRVATLLSKNPDLGVSPGFGMVLEWISSGMKTAFIQDANSIILDTEELVDILAYLRKTFPCIQRVTSYARARTLARKSLSELKAIKNAGLDRLHVGLESGDEAILERIKKGASPEDHLEASRKAMDAGFQLSQYWMPGLGGKKFWKEHAINTAALLNKINPHYIRSRPFFPHPGTPLFYDVEKGHWPLLSPKEQLLELKETVKALDVTSKICFDHAGNYWCGPKGRPVFKHTYEGYQFPEKKPHLLELIEEGIRFQELTPSGPPIWLVR
ncbi:MAG: radical SAM protein [Desulfobacteraceae bacterium]|nr:MAG: radical SAM protein [Desulfobacteraceae bacterium]